MSEAASSEEPRGEFVTNVKDLKVGDEVWYRPTHDKRWMYLEIDTVDNNGARSCRVAGLRTRIYQEACDERRVARVLSKPIALNAAVARVEDAIKEIRAHESLKAQLTNAQSDISRVSAEKTALEKELAALRNGTELVKAQARANTAEAEVKRLTAAYDKLASSDRERDYLVELRYFKASGKYYSAGSYFTTKQHMFEIFEEVHERAHGGDLPDLVPGVKEFAVLINVPSHPHNHPYLVYPSGTP